MHDEGDVSFAEIRQVAQHDRLSLTSGEAAKPVHQITTLADVRIDQAERAVDVGQGAAPPPDAVNGQIRGDPGDPTLRTVLEAIPPERRPRQRLLGHIFGIPAVPQHAERHPIGKPVEAVKSQIKTGRTLGRESAVDHGVGPII